MKFRVTILNIINNRIDFIIALFKNTNKGRI